MVEHLPALTNPYSPLCVDEFEPVYVSDLLGQSCDAVRCPLNRQGNADYMWIDSQGHSIQIERKQWGEMLGSLDAVENQLRREIPLADKTCLLVEGVVVPTPYGLDAYVWDALRQGYRLSHCFGNDAHPQPGLYAKVMAWWWQLDSLGVSVWQTPNMEGTARAIAAWYVNSQKESHSTLNRHLKPRVGPKRLSSHVLSLMGLEGAGLGEVRAEALVQVFGTVYDVVTAGRKELEQVEGLGKGTVSKLFKAIGRIE